MTTVRVGYHRSHGILLVGLGILCSVLGMMSVSVTPRPTFGTYGPLLSGGVCILIGIMMRTRPLFELGPDRIVMFALLGPLRREYPFASRREVRLVGDRVMVGGKKLPLRRGRCDAQDWAVFAAAVQFE